MDAAYSVGDGERHTVGARVQGAGRVRTLLGIASPTGNDREARRRLGWLTSLDALAVAKLRRYGYDRRTACNGKAGNSLADVAAGEPRTERRANRFDARVVRVIDFECALSAIGSHNAALLQMYYCDGEPAWLIGEALGIGVRTVQAMIPPALKLLVSELERRDLL